ncbi:hypothetical protein [Streptomyces sp. NPDC093600]|uniref:hypothetical protein n=1 Tax=Streptomyces sp. NPDC093600 TaxID=3366047 RepID=UPI00380F878D
MTVDIRVIRAGRMYRYYFARPCSATVAARLVRRCAPPRSKPVSRPGDGWAAAWPCSGWRWARRSPRASSADLFGERGRHPYADRIEADRLAKGASAKNSRDPGLDDRIVAAAISTFCLDISEPKSVRGLESGYRVYTARWDLSDLPARRRPSTPAPGPDRHPPADPGEPAAPRPPGQDAGEWEISRVQSRYERAVLAGAVVREKLRTTITSTAVGAGRTTSSRCPEQLLASAAADPEHDDQEPEAGPRWEIDLTALRAMKAHRRGRP